MDWGYLQFENRQWKILCVFVIGAIVIAYLSLSQVRSPDVPVALMSMIRLESKMLQAKLTLLQEKQHRKSLISTLPENEAT